MKSFINLLGNDFWSDADIVSRTEAMIASEFPTNAVAILNRKVTAATIGQYVLTEGEMAEVGRYAQVCGEAAVAGNLSRDDMGLLMETVAYEVAAKRLKVPPVELLIVGLDGGNSASNQAEVDSDLAERAVAISTVSSASQVVLDLADLRNQATIVTTDLLQE